MAYELSHSYLGDSFVNDFNWFNGDDPSNGFVRYQSQSDALDQGLYTINSDGPVILSVDTTNTFPTTEGRPSVRLESKKTYNGGLFIGDFAHMPASACGVWPAFWMYGPDWPNKGEIDIIEGANRATRNLISAHTSEGCSIPESGIDTAGEAISFDCTSPGNNNNAGCSFLPDPSDTATYGDTFNAVGGGVYAMEWASEAIKIWHWSRQNIPDDIVDKKPDVGSWGPPTALFGTSTCDIDTYFKDMSIVIQTNFCGDYAGPAWGNDESCGSLADTCEEHVGSSPDSFTNAYWEVNYIDVYETGHGEASASEEPTTTTTIGQTSTTTVTVFPTSANGTMPITSSSPIPSRTSAISSNSVPGNTTVPATDDVAPVRDPANIGTFAFLGCFGSLTGFPSFEVVDEGADMTPEVCVESCSSQRYAGIHDDMCLCADVLDGGDQALSDRNECDMPCPGNSTEACGGLLSDPSLLAKRQELTISDDLLISLYGNVGGEEETPELPPAALGLENGGRGRNSTAPSNSTSSPVPKSQPVPSATSTIVGHVTQSEERLLFPAVTTVWIPYVTICPTDVARLITTEYCATYTLNSCGGGCNEPDAVPEPEFTTITKTCDACGPSGENTVTLTVPLSHTVTVSTRSQQRPQPGPTAGGGMPPVGPPGDGEDQGLDLVQIDDAPVLDKKAAIFVPILVAAVVLVM